MSVSDGQTGNASVFNAAFVSRTSNTGTSGILALTNAAPASGPSITNLQGTVNDAITVLVGFEARITDIEDNTFTFAGNKTFSGNVVIAGNLTVQGTTTAVDTDNLEVEDKNILINKGGNDASAEGAGLTVTRTAVNGSFVYDSSLPALWKIGNSATEREVLVSGVAQIIGGEKTFTDNTNFATSIKLLNDAGDFGVLISADDAMAANYSLKLPATQGAASTVLTNDGFGNLTWAAGGGGGPSTPEIRPYEFLSGGGTISNAADVVWLDTNVPDFSVTMPPAPTQNQIIKLVGVGGSDVGQITLLPNAGQSFDGLTSPVVKFRRGVKLQYVGADWYTLADDREDTDFIRQVITFTQLAASGAAAGLVYAATYNIPERHILETATIHVKTAFTGAHSTAVASLTSSNYSLTGLNLLLADDTKTAALNYKYVGADTPGLTIETTGANIGDFTAGEIEIIMKLKRVDTIAAKTYFNET